MKPWFSTFGNLKKMNHPSILGFRGTSSRHLCVHSFRMHHIICLGKVVVEASLDKEVFYHGEDIPLHISINNQSKKQAKSIMVSLKSIHLSIWFYKNITYIYTYNLCIYERDISALLTLFHVGGEETSPPPISFCWITFFCKNRIDLKLLDFLSFTYTHPIHLKNLKIVYYSSVDNHPKLTEIGKNG